MLVKSILKRFLSIFVPLILLALLGTAIFAIGARTGQRHQSKDDLVLITVAVEAVSYCSIELAKFDELKKVANQSSAEVHKLQPDQFCDKLCNTLVTTLNNAFIVRGAYVGLSGDCICFIAPDL